MKNKKTFLFLGIIFLVLSISYMTLDFNENSVETLVKDMVNSESETRIESLNKMVALGEQGLPHAVRLAITDDIQKSLFFSEYFGLIGSKSLVYLINSCQDSDISFNDAVYEYFIDGENDEEKITILLDALLNSNLNVKYNALRIIGNHLSYGADLSRVIDMLNVDNDRIKFEALKIIGEFGSSENEKILEEFAHSSNQLHKLYAVSYLVKRGRNLLHNVIEKLYDSGNKDLKITVVECIAITKNKNYESFLIKRIDATEDEELGSYIIRILGVLGTKKAVNYLYEALNHNKQYIRDMAQNTLKYYDYKKE